jgi:hypothetical protein
MLFHDYWYPETELLTKRDKPFVGVKKAVDEFFANRPEKLFIFPETTHALIVKQH